MSLSKREQKQPAAMLSTSSPSAATATAPLPSSAAPPLSIPARRSSNSQQLHQQQQVATLAMLQQHQTHHAPTHSSNHNGSSSSSSSSSRHHHQHSTSASSTSNRASLRAVPESDWLSGSSSRRPRKSSVNMSSLAAGAAAAGSSSSNTAPTNSATPVAPPTAVPPRSSSTSMAATAGTSASATPTPSRPTSTLTILPHAAAPAPAPVTSPATITPTKLDPARYATEDFNFSARHTWTEEKEKIVCGPFEYLNGVKGKEFRTQLINAFNGWLEVPEDALSVITRVVGMLHTASLLVDDVEDSSSLRRGLPVAHNIFGVPQTINSANYIYFLALQELQTLRNPRQLVAVFAEELCNLHRGQGMDLFWRDTLTCPTEDDYLEMVGHKTGGLFRLGIKLMQAESRSHVDCVPLVNLLGLLFQIQDDYRNLMASEYSQNKGMCEDLTEGKFSFPVIHSIRSSGSGDGLQLLNILKQKTNDEEVKRYAVSHMERTGSFAYTRQVMAILTERARKLADELDEGKGRSRAVHAILDRLSITN